MAVSDEYLERLYDTGTARIVTQRNDFLLPNLLESIDQDMYINLNPTYQRRLRWDRTRKSKLIESLLMNVPIPPVFLYEVDLARYEVMDGQQRLSTIREFFNNEFPLSGLEEWPWLNRRRYSDLPGRIQLGLHRRAISAIIVLSESLGDIKRFVFERLNTGGVRLNAQEVRNAIYGGPFNDLLHELSRSPLFTLIWEIPSAERIEARRPSSRLASNSLYRQMIDCEIVLRFFALADTSRLTTSMSKSLDATMQHYQNESALMAALRDDFATCLTTSHEIYGDSTFRLPATGSRPKRPLSRALYDAVMIGLLAARRRVPEEGWPQVRQALIQRRSDIRTATEELLADRDSYALLVGRLNTKASIVERIALMDSIFETFASQT